MTVRLLYWNAGGGEVRFGDNLSLEGIGPRVSPEQP